MVLVVATVWQLSAGRTTSGNLLNLAACTAWAVVAMNTEQWSLLSLQVVLFLRSIYILGRDYAVYRTRAP